MVVQQSYPLDTVKTLYQGNFLFTRDGQRSPTNVTWLKKEAYRGMDRFQKSIHDCPS
jgi:hypothetical protein